MSEEANEMERDGEGWRGMERDGEGRRETERAEAIAVSQELMVE